VLMSANSPVGVNFVLESSVGRVVLTSSTVVGEAGLVREGVSASSGQNDWLALEALEVLSCVVLNIIRVSKVFVGLLATSVISFGQDVGAGPVDIVAISGCCLGEDLGEGFGVVFSGDTNVVVLLDVKVYLCVDFPFLFIVMLAIQLKFKGYSIFTRRFWNSYNCIFPMRILSGEGEKRVKDCYLR
jgi:hypothetical protein